MLIVEFELTHNHITRTSQDEGGRFGIDLTFDLHKRPLTLVFLQ